MIDTLVLDRRATLAGAEFCLATIMNAEAEQLALAGHWADLHDPASLPPATTDFEVRRRRFDEDYGVQPGGEGTPEVLRSCFAELGVVLQTSAGGAKHLIADALDLRHRLPQLWAEVQSGRVRGWKARRVAQATRHLPSGVMAEVDGSLAGVMTTLSWSRFSAVLDATVMRADPVGAAHVEAEASSRRFVSLGLDGGRGLTTVIARGEVLDILTFLAAVNRIAELLELEGDSDAIGVRRSKAVGILGQPDRALAMLARHQHDDATEARPEAETEGDQPDESDVANEPDEHRAEEERGSRSIDLDRLVPSRRSPAAAVRVQLFVHLTDAALNGQDPTAVCRVKIPHSVREAVLLRNPASVFPWSRSTERPLLQLDHVEPHLAVSRGGPPGQTGPANLAPLVGTEHQRKTSRRWQERSPAPGVFLWRSPHGWVELVTNQGTFPLGHGPGAQAIWRATAPSRSTSEAVAA